MIFCYSATQKSRLFADVLSDILGKPVYMLESAVNLGGSNTLRLLWPIITRQPVEVVNMPEDIPEDEIYICAPVWGGFPASPIRAFLKHVRGKKVHMILTAGMGHIKYIKAARKMIEDAGCIAGNVEVFADGGDRKIVEEHIRELMLDLGSEENP